VTSFMSLTFPAAKFYKSFGSVKQMPESTKKQYAFIGRSNVGKSSLINALVSKKDLAKTSSKPGKTQLINLFDIDDTIYFVDLPGYGYAKVSKTKRDIFEGLITEYILDNPNLGVLFILIDGSIPPQQIDVDFINWCGEHQVPICLVFTKIDKKKKKFNFEDNQKALFDHLAHFWSELPNALATSSEKKIGIDEMQEWITLNFNML